VTSVAGSKFRPPTLLSVATFFATAVATASELDTKEVSDGFEVIPEFAKTRASRQRRSVGRQLGFAAGRCRT